MIADCVALSDSVSLLVAGSQLGRGPVPGVANLIGPANKDFKLVDLIRQVASLLTRM